MILRSWNDAGILGDVQYDKFLYQESSMLISRETHERCSNQTQQHRVVVSSSLRFVRARIVVCLSHLSTSNSSGAKFWEKTRIEVEFFSFLVVVGCSTIKSLAIVEITFVFDCLSCGADTPAWIRCGGFYFLYGSCSRSFCLKKKKKSVWKISENQSRDD